MFDMICHGTCCMQMIWSYQISRRPIFRRDLGNGAEALESRPRSYSKCGQNRDYMICARTAEPQHSASRIKQGRLWKVENFRYLGSVIHVVFLCTASTIYNNKAVRSQRWPRDARYISSRCGPCGDMAIRNIQDGGGRHLEFVWIENSAIRSAVPENPTLEQNMRWIARTVAEIWPFEFFQHGGGRHLGFVRTVNSAVRSAVPENPTIEPNMKWIGSPVAEIWLFAYVGGIWNFVLGEGEVVGGQRWHQ